MANYAIIIRSGEFEISRSRLDDVYINEKSGICQMRLPLEHSKHLKDILEDDEEAKIHPVIHSDIVLRKPGELEN